MTDRPSDSLTAVSRLALLRRLGLLVSVADPLFERIGAAALLALGARGVRIGVIDGDAERLLGQVGAWTDDPGIEHFCRRIVEVGAPLASDDGAAGEPLSVGLADTCAGGPLVGEDGVAVGFVCATADAGREWTRSDMETLRELARTAAGVLELRLEKAVLEAMRDSSDDGLLVVSLEREVVARNDRFSELWGMSRDALKSEAADALLDSVLPLVSQPEALRALMEEAYARPAEEVVDEIPLRDGRVLSSRGTPWRDPGGAPQGRIWQFRDITGPRRAKLALEESEARLRAFMETAPDAAFSVDEQGVLTYANPAVERIFGYTASELIGRPLTTLIPDRAHPARSGGAERRPLGIRRIAWGAMELVGLHRDGREIPIEISFGRFTSGRRTFYTGIVRDIAQRKQVDQVLHDAALSYRSLFDSLQDLVCIIDVDGNLLSVNAAVLERYGFSLEEILGSTPDRLSAPGSSELSALLQQVRDGPSAEPVLFEWWGRTKSGEIFPIEVVLTRGEYFGAPVVIAVGRDITERKRAEQALRRLGTIVESSADGIISLSVEGTVTSWNTAAERIFGYTPEEILGRSWSAIIPAEERDAYERTRGVLVSGGGLDPYEAVRVRADGERIRVAVTAFPIHDAAGRVTGTAAIVRDVTETNAREEQRRLLAAALERLDEGVSLETFSGEIVYANQNHGRILGYDSALRPLPSLRDFAIDEEMAIEQEEIVRRVVEEGGWVGRVRRRRVADGRVIPLELIMGRIDREGEGPNLLFCIVRDITEQLERERVLRRAERLASLGTLVGGAAHELNNPLHAVRSFAELMLLDRRTPEDVEALEIIKREADRAAKIVSDLRVFARQTQDETTERTAVDLNDVVRHIAKVRRHSLATRRITIVEDLAGELPPVRANLAEVEQVVLNLWVNAEQAMATEPGERRLLVRTLADSCSVTLVLTDSGSGIAPEHRDRIFDPFFTTKPPGEGTGLGLSIVHSIVAEHGGEIRVESGSSAGTTFSVVLPRATVGQVPARSTAGGG